MSENKLEAAVGMSRKWDAREAGREVAESAISQLSNSPKFLVFVTTAHYEKYGGFQEFIDGIWEVLPKNTVLIGETVSGFINNKGSFSRGTSAIGVSYPHMQVCAKYGQKTKRNPQRASHHCAKAIKNELAGSRFKNNFLLNFVSGPETIKLPGKGFTNFIDSGLISRFIPLFFGASQYLLQKGPGREDEVLEALVRDLPDYSMLLGASLNDYKGANSYQFIGNKILTNALASLGISTDLDFDVCTTHGMKETSIKFEITKVSRDGHIIHKINNKPAVPELLRLLGWPNGFLNEKTLYNIIPYYPISLRRRERQVPVVMPGIIKDSIIIPCIIEKGEVSILTVSGKDLIAAVRNNMNHFRNISPKFGLISACLTILQTLGYKTNMVLSELQDYFKDAPFLLYWSGGEGTYSLADNITYANMSFNTAVFGEKIT